jgi:hypothetical protein
VFLQYPCIKGSSLSLYTVAHAPTLFLFDLHTV